MGHEISPGGLSGAERFADVNNRDLARRFLESGRSPEMVDKEAGRELTRRLHVHAGYGGDPATEPLLRPDGEPVLDEAEQPVMRIDYLGWSLVSHPWAIKGILGFLFTQPGSPEYETGLAAYVSHAAGNQPQAGKG